MPKTQEPAPDIGPKMRAALRPNDDRWREHVSQGALRAYDRPLAAQREEAAALRKRGRLIAAHKREKASYKIRVRGHDRARRAAVQESSGIEKGIRGRTAKKAASQVRRTEKTLKIGPFERTIRDMRVGPRSRGEEFAEMARGVGTGLGGAKLAVGALAGAAGGGAAVTAKERAQDARERALAATRIKQKKPDAEGVGDVRKMLVSKSTAPHMLILSHGYAANGLYDIHKGFWSEAGSKVSGAFKQATNDAAGAWRTTRLGPTPGSYDEAAQSAFNSLKDSAAGKTAAYAGLAGAAGWGAKAGYGKFVAPRIGRAKKTLAGYKKKAMYGAAGAGALAVGAPTVGAYLGARSGD